MTEAEIDLEARRFVAAARKDGEDVQPWEDMPEHVRELWRELVRGNGGVALD